MTFEQAQQTEPVDPTTVPLPESASEASDAEKQDYQTGKHGGVYVVKTTRTGNTRKIYFKELNVKKATKVIGELIDTSNLTEDEIKNHEEALQKKRDRNERRRESRKRKREEKKGNEEGDNSKDDEVVESGSPEKKQKTE
jgi:hypothetical protein